MKIMPTPKPMKALSFQRWLLLAETAAVILALAFPWQSAHRKAYFPAWICDDHLPGVVLAVEPESPAAGSTVLSFTLQNHSDAVVEFGLTPTPQDDGVYADAETPLSLFKQINGTWCVWTSPAEQEQDLVSAGVALEIAPGEDFGPMLLHPMQYLPELDSGTYRAEFRYWVEQPPELGHRVFTPYIASVEFTVA